MSTDTTTTPDHPTLQHFTLDDLAVYTAEQAFGPTASPDFRVFYVGRDDVHGVLMHLYTRVSLSVKMNMFGYDDDDLNKALMGLVQNPSVMVQVTLDKSQSGGAHEKAILATDMAQDAAGCQRLCRRRVRHQPDQPHQGRDPRRHRRVRRLDQLVILG